MTSLAKLEALIDGRQPLWTELPEVAAILAEFAVNPPERREFKYAHGDSQVRYFGPKVTRLKGIWNRVSAELYATDLDAWYRHADVTVQDAIRAAVEKAPSLRLVPNPLPHSIPSGAET